MSRAAVLESREQLWGKCLEYVSQSGPLTYVEYGVHEGYSIRFFASRNTSPDSAFFGLDSFEGLPEEWKSASMPKGSFNVGGSAPTVDDGRVRFIKGWFQETATHLLSEIAGRGTQPLVVHYDADLYSSTLFALSAMATLRRSYFAIFDEFIGHETRALYNFTQAYRVEIDFLAQTLWRDEYPQQVLCRISAPA